MSYLNMANRVPTEYYRPEQYLCPFCHDILKRHHILWHKNLTFSTGAKQVVSWAYRCPQNDCPGAKVDYRSAKAESLHLKHRRFSRELIVRIGYRRFWQHQPHGLWPIVGPQMGGNGGLPAILFCFAFFLLVFLGPGAYALDTVRSRRTRRQVQI